MANKDKPWLNNKQWRRGVIRSYLKIYVILMVSLSFIWNSIVYRIQIDAGNAVIALSLKIIGAIIVCFSFYFLMKLIKFGESVFRLAAVPGVIGGKLIGLVETNVRQIPADGFHVSLLCFRYKSSRSSSSNTTVAIEWSETHTVKTSLLRSKSSRYGVPIHFDIPSYVQETGSTRKSLTSETFKWKLEVKASLPGVDYSDNFIVPVYETENAKPDIVFEDVPVVEYESTPISAPSEIPGISVFETAAGVQEITLKPFRYPAALRVWVLVTAFLAGFLIFWEQINFASKVIIGVMEMILSAITFGLAFYTSRIRVHRNDLTCSTGWIVPWFTKRYMISNIKSITKRTVASCGKKVYYHVLIVLSNNNTYVILKYIQGHRQADFLVNSIKRLLGQDQRQEVGELSFDTDLKTGEEVKHYDANSGTSVFLIRFAMIIMMLLTSGYFIYSIFFKGNQKTQIERSDNPKFNRLTKAKKRTAAKKQSRIQSEYSRSAEIMAGYNTLFKPRKWKNAKGKSATATFVMLEEESVYLKKVSSGNVFKIQMSNLHGDDQRFVKKFISAGLDLGPNFNESLSGKWLVRNKPGFNRLNAVLKKTKENQYHFSPQNLAYSGFYEIRGNTLVMTKSRGGHRGFIWKIKDKNHLFLTNTTYKGTTMSKF